LSRMIRAQTFQSIFQEPLFPVPDGWRGGLQPLFDNRKGHSFGQHQDQLARNKNPPGSERDCAISFRSVRCYSDSWIGSPMKGT
jgi:hypothetical protein